MYPNITVNFGNLLLSLSDAMDLASPLIASHQQRTAFIAWEICKSAGLPEHATEEIFVAALLHDVGAITPEEKINIQKFEECDTETHCIRGELFLEGEIWLQPAAQLVRHHHREWCLWNKNIDEPAVLGSQIILLSDYLERKVKRNRYILLQNKSLTKTIQSLSGKKVHPQVVNYFLETAHREEFWLDLASPRLYSLLLNHGPYKRLEVDLADITRIAKVFRNIIDFRSQYTATHSSGVAECAATIARLFGFTETETELVEVAGNLHDIGKLVVPNSILNKAGKLTTRDFAIIKQHPYHTFSILNTIGGLRDIAEWAAFHHEKLDGSGYPFHHRANKLSTQSRIVTIADMFTAMSENRPYRVGMKQEWVLAELRKQAEANTLDKQIVGLLHDNYQDIRQSISEKQSITQAYYDKKFAVLAAEKEPV